MSFDKIFKTYIEAYTEHKKVEIKLDVIKQGIKKQYEQQEERLLKTNGVIVRTKFKKEYEIKAEIYDFLEDYGYLPLVVKVNKSIENHFNLEKARIDHKQSVRLYSGGKSIVDKDAIIESYKDYLEYGLEELTNEFKRATTEEKLSKSSLEQIKEQLKQAMPGTSIPTQFGTLKLTDTYDYDMNIVFDGISGKKEVFIKKSEDEYDVVIYPDEKSFKLSGDQEIGLITFKEEVTNSDNETEIRYEKIPATVEDLYTTSDNEIESKFVKKRPFKAFIKDGYVFNHFETEVDPFEFFRNCKISKTKIDDLIHQGIIDEKDITPFLELTGESDYVEVMSEGAAEQQASIYQKKLMEKAQNYRMRRDENYVESSTTSSSQTPQVDITDFSF